MTLRPVAVALVASLLAACAATPTARVVPEPVTSAASSPAPRPTVRQRPACVDCGRVDRIEVVSAIRATSSGGAVLGGVVGGVVSAPRRSATPAKPATASASGGVVGTAAAATPRPPQRAWRVHLHMDDGRKLVVHQNLLSREIVAGSRVRLVQGRLVPLH